MKKLLFPLAACFIFCAAGAIGYKIYDSQTISSTGLLMARNLEVLTQNENPKGYAISIDIQNPCYIEYKGNRIPGVWQNCLENQGDLTTCSTGCIQSTVSTQ